ncbi:MAG: LysM peptidoglycan-binding domain-containing protein [bacterium]|nr:MAG: LysM peptidoglycan-binding domain-containing protein [bacterium]
MRALAAPTMVLALLLALPFPSNAGEVSRTVRQGQSLSLICQQAYGKAELYAVVGAYNGIEDPTMVAPGDRVRLPYADNVALGQGESLSALAKRRWGDPRLYSLIVWANGIQDPARVPAGTRLTLPFLIPYRLKRGETVSMVAERFYGDPKEYAPVLAASGIADATRVAVGSRLLVPYVLPRPAREEAPPPTRPRAAKTSPAPAARPTPPPKPQAESAPREDTARVEALGLLDRAEAAFRSGEYGDAWTMGHEASKGLQGREKARAYRLLAASQYAFGKNDAALEDLRAAYALDPDHTPDPVLVNPEMMDLYEKARR